jgi:catechol 2,3-dioxygenase-like lactoylglutathione lyase family enzyme
MTPQLTHTRLLVRDFAACFRFYRDILGLEVTWGEEDGDYADFRTGTAQLALFKRQLMAEAVGNADKPAQAECQDCVALIFAVDNVDEACRQLQAKGIRFVTEPMDRPDWGIRTAHLRDPDRNLIELYTDLA